MTPNETLKALRRAGKPIVRSHLYRLFNLLGIKPLGRARPQQYPPDTASRILSHLGFGTMAPASQPKFISLPQLRAAKPRTTKKGTRK